MVGPNAAAAREPVHEGRHAGAVEEWVFAAWTADARLGVVSGHRIVGATAWYWAALARSDRPLLHITDFEVPVRADPFIVKGEAMWAEHVCDAPGEQWSVGNETYASALDDADEALGRGYGTPTPIAFDLEWYASARPTPVDTPRDTSSPGERVSGYVQEGVVHGRIEILGEDPVDLVEVPARRWHRWATDPGRRTSGETHRSASLPPLDLPDAAAHTGVRAPFAFPDGSVLDLVLTRSGWARRRVR
ncbi:MAG: hypothetical protein AAFP84_03935 [Actinomycetota bacterium]